MLLFAIQGDAITVHPLDVVRIALPLLAYFALMFAVSFAGGISCRLRLPAHGDAGLHRRLEQLRAAIAVAVGVFGATSGRHWPAWSAR